VLGYRPEPHSLKVPKSLYQSPSGTSGSRAFPRSQFVQIFLGDLTLLGASAQMSPHPSGQALPLNFGHASLMDVSAAED